MDEDRKRALRSALSQIERQFGKGAVMRMGDASAVRDVGFISTGSLGLDVALGIGGLPRGRVVEIYGPESSGKTTLTLEVVAQAQKQGGTAAFIDAEHALDPQYAEKIGVNVDELLVSQPDTGEQALEIADMIVRSGGGGCRGHRFGGGAHAPRGARRGDGRLPRRVACAAHVAGAAQAHRQHQALQHPGDFHQPDPDEDRCDVRQPRDHDRGQCAQVLRFGAPRHPAHRLDQEGGRDNRQRNPGQGGQEQARPSLQEGGVRHPLRGRISRQGELIDLGVKHGMVEKAGAWYSYRGDRIGQGRDNVRNFLREHEDVASSLDSALRDRLLAREEANPASPEEVEA